MAGAHVKSRLRVRMARQYSSFRSEGASRGAGFGPASLGLRGGGREGAVRIWQGRTSNPGCGFEWLASTRLSDLKVQAAAPDSAQPAWVSAAAAVKGPYGYGRGARQIPVAGSNGSPVLVFPI